MNAAYLYELIFYNSAAEKYFDIKSFIWEENLMYPCTFHIIQAVPRTFYMFSSRLRWYTERGISEIPGSKHLRRLKNFVTSAIVQN